LESRFEGFGIMSKKPGMSSEKEWAIAVKLPWRLRTIPSVQELLNPITCADA
jgi:hypothetical protein